MESLEITKELIQEYSAFGAIVFLISLAAIKYILVPVFQVIGKRIAELTDTILKKIPLIAEDKTQK